MIAHKLPDRIDFSGRTYRVNLAFDIVLRVFELQRDPLFDTMYKVSLTLELLAGRKACKLPFQQQTELYKALFDQFITIPGKKRGGPAVMDFTQDAPYIYAAFMQAYRIDLNAEQGRLDWRHFMALLRGLPENTKLREIMDIRGRKLPKQTKYNADEVRRLVEAKAFYALDFTKEAAANSFQSDLDRIAGELERRARSAQ